MEPFNFRQAQSSDEQEVVQSAEQALKQIQDMLLKAGAAGDQIPDRIELRHPTPAFTQAVDAIIAREDPNPPHPSSYRKSRP